LTLADVLAAARQLLTARGLEALTMRTLAERLGVSPNTLYSHVQSKTALIDDLLDDALAAVNAPDPDTSNPVAGLHTLMTSTYQVLLARADLIPLYLGRRGARGPNAQHLGDVMLALLARTRVTGTRAREARHVLIVYTIGSAAFAARSPLGDNDTSSSAIEDHHAHFDRGLRWILTGLTAPQ
jgi:AcrR family transcriptional regulator